MKIIDCLMEEHRNILDFTVYMREKCLEIMMGEAVDTDLFRQCIFFAVNYADRFHHGKEEEVLFDLMLKSGDKAAEKLIRGGMYVEHDMGRFYLSELEKSLEKYDSDPSEENRLDVIADSMSYCKLLKRHIEKEDEVVYSFATRILRDDVKAEADRLGADRDANEDNAALKESCLEWLREKKDNC